jgi:Skp family chaperone for outer membrane proteins
VLDGNRAIRVSAAGVAANSQLQGFSTQAQSEIAATRDALVRDDKALAAAKATLQAADYQAKANALRTRQQALQRDVQARNAQLEAARTDANSHIGQTMAAAANEVVNQHHCSVVLDATKIYGAAPGMNITDQVVQIMNVRQPSFTVQMPARPGGAAAPQH